MNDLKNDIIIGKQISLRNLKRTIGNQSLVYLLLVISKPVIKEIYNGKYVSSSYSLNALELITPVFYLINVGVFLASAFWVILLVVAYISGVDRVRLIGISLLFVESLIVAFILLLEAL